MKTKPDLLICDTGDLVLAETVYEEPSGIREDGTYSMYSGNAAVNAAQTGIKAERERVLQAIQYARGCADNENPAAMRTGLHALCDALEWMLRGLA